MLREHERSAIGAPAQAGAAHSEGEHEYTAMLRRWMWRDFANILIGCWLIATPFALIDDRSAIFWSDVISGGLVVVLGILTFFPRFDLARWGICFIGIWLLFAPLIFWTRDAGVYAIDTLVGSLLIAFSVLIPMMPGRTHHVVMMTPGPDTPPGWSYNPSDWTQRGPIIAMAFLTELSRWNDVLVGIALIGLSTRRGRITARFGGWNRYLI
jgi:hypothetical protein